MTVEKDGITLESAMTGGGNNPPKDPPKDPIKEEPKDPIVDPKTEDPKEPKTEDKSEGRTALLEQFKGGSFTPDGSIVDAVGRIVKTPEEVEEMLKASKEDEVNYFLDDDENLVDAEGNIVVKKDDIQRDEEGNILLPAAQEEALMDELVTIGREKGFEFKDAEGNTVSFPDTKEGYFQYAEALGNQMANEHQAQLQEAFPEAYALMEHMIAGGDASKFYESRMNMTDYSQVNYDKNNKEGRKMVIKDFLTKVQKNNDEMADYMIKAMTDSGDIDKFYDSSINGLRQHQDALKKEEVAQRKAAIKEREENTVKYWNGIGDIITDGKLHSIHIPDHEKKEFFSYLSKDSDGKGNSAATRRKAELTPQQLLEVDYLIYKGFNLKKLIEAQAKEDKAAGLRKRKATVKLQHTPRKRQAVKGGKGASLKTLK